MKAVEVLSKLQSKQLTNYKILLTRDSLMRELALESDR